MGIEMGWLQHRLNSSRKITSINTNLIVQADKTFMPPLTPFSVALESEIIAGIVFTETTIKCLDGNEAIGNWPINF